MLDGRIGGGDAAPAQVDLHISTVRALHARLENFASAAGDSAASQHNDSPESSSLLKSRYAAANSVTRRRFDTLLKEARLTATVGFRLIEGRPSADDAGTIAAARFLGSSLATAIHRLEMLLAPRIAA